MSFCWPVDADAAPEQVSGAGKICPHKPSDEDSLERSVHWKTNIFQFLKRLITGNIRKINKNADALHR